jgi:ATP-dependent RNA circularization protein (DNA/RNA ligase family)
MKKVITVDFDETLAKTSTVWNGWMHLGEGVLEPIPEIFDIVFKRAEEGYEIVIVTFRQDKDIQEVKNFVKEYQLPISKIINTCGKPKLPFLKKLHSILHIDDDLGTVLNAEKAGINAILVDDGKHEKNSSAELVDKIRIK